MKKGPVTQEDIARRLKVSRITVSKALRDHPDISEAMKQKVLKTADSMGYIVNLVASNLSKSKTDTIGVVIPDLENSFFAFLTDSIIDVATENNYRVILTVSRENADTENKNIRILTGMRVDGLLVCVSQETAGKKILEYPGNTGIPLVFFDRVIKNAGYSYISFDDRAGTRDAIVSLIASGYRRFAHFAGFSKISVGKERSSSFRNTLKKNGITVKNEWIIEGGFEVKDGYLAFQKLMKSGDLPEVIIAVNDRVALGAYRAIAEAGLKIPDDIGVVGYGFNETTDMFSPPLAVINQDPRSLGISAITMLINEIIGKNKSPSKMLVSEQFIRGGSVKI